MPFFRDILGSFGDTSASLILDKLKLKLCYPKTRNKHVLFFFASMANLGQCGPGLPCQKLEQMATATTPNTGAKRATDVSTMKLACPGIQLPQAGCVGAFPKPKSAKPISSLSPEPVILSCCGPQGAGV